MAQPGCDWPGQGWPSGPPGAGRAPPQQASAAALRLRRPHRCSISASSRAISSLPFLPSFLAWSFSAFCSCAIQHRRECKRISRGRAEQPRRRRLPRRRACRTRLWRCSILPRVSAPPPAPSSSLLSLAGAGGSGSFRNLALGQGCCGFGASVAASGAAGAGASSPSLSALGPARAARTKPALPPPPFLPIAAYSEALAKRCRANWSR